MFFFFFFFFFSSERGRRKKKKVSFPLSFSFLFSNETKKVQYSRRCRPTRATEVISSLGLAAGAERGKASLCASSEARLSRVKGESGF